MKTWEYSHPLDILPKLQQASFRFWVDDMSQPINGFLCLVPGTNGDGRGEIDNGKWQAIAKELGFGLIGCFFQDKDLKSADYCLADDGSGQTLVNAINEFGKEHKVNVKQSKLLLWGYSAGGQFNFNFARWKPNRVLGFIVNKGAHYYHRQVRKPTRAIPAIFFLGEQDTPERIENIREVFAENRNKGAKWALCEEPKCAHGICESERVSYEFFKAVTKGDKENCWTGNNETLEIYPAKEEVDYSKTSCLPNEETAIAWKNAQI